MSWRSVTVVALVLIAPTISCAKLPVGSQASTPAPSAAGPRTEAPPPAAVTPGAASAAPTTPSRPGTASSAQAARPMPREFGEVTQLKDIYFDFDRYDVRAADAKVLDANVEWLKANPPALLLIEGHCDERGTSEYNLALGERRARAAMSYLVARGIAANRISFISYGEERPACAERSEPCWGRNRRAHFLAKAG